MSSLSEERQKKPAKWERVYGQLINVLFAVAGALFTWNVFSTGDWRARSGYIFIVVWIIALRVGTRLIPAPFIARVQDWRAARRIHEFGFSLLWIGFPLSVFGHLVRWYSRWELVTMILIMSLLPLFMGRPTLAKAQSTITLHRARRWRESKPASNRAKTGIVLHDRLYIGTRSTLLLSHKFVVATTMESSLLIDRIRMLCAKAIATPPANVGPVIWELKEALREHSRIVRSLAASPVLSEPPDTGDVT